MVHYRRNLIPGGTFFFTVAVKNRSSTLLTDHIDLLRTSFKKTLSKYPMSIDAIVILPDHLHTIWTLPPGDYQYAKRWQAIKSDFTRQMRRNGKMFFQYKNGEYALWQRRYWEHTIRDERDLRRHIDYIHFNPVKHGYVENVRHWPYSSFHQFVNQGILPAYWGTSIDEEYCYGE